MKYILAILIFLIVLPLTATDLYKQHSDGNAIVQESLNARFRTSYEVIELSATDNMGVLGTHFDFYPIESFNPFYASLGFYSALTGEDGGFFAYGYTMGLDYKFYNYFHIDGGVYVGGGAGEYIGFDNGGMLLRSHVALSYELKGAEIVVGLARTDFPNTTKHKEYESDVHPYFGINISSDAWSQSSDSNYSSNLNNFDGLFRDIRITPAVVMYKIDDKPTKRSKYYQGSKAYQDDFPMLGIQVDKFLTENIFVSMEAYGALSSAAGYAALQAGLGYDMVLTDFLIWESKMVAGSAGDSRIDTGGGFILQPMTGFRFEMTPSLSFKTLAGRTYAPDGLFSTTTYEVGLSWKANQPVVKKGKYLFDLDSFDNLEWVMSPSVKIYFPYDSLHKDSKEESSEKIGLIGITLAVPLSDWFSLTGSTHWATTGNVGSYAEGLFGAKLSTAHFTPLKIKGMILGEIGAGAGAGINTSSGGYVAQISAGFALPISKNTGVSLNGGHMRTSDGRFKANTVLLAFDLNLNLIFKKN